MLDYGNPAYLVNLEFYKDGVRLNMGYITSNVDKKAISIDPDILIYYTDFLHVFLEEEAGILASHGDYNYRIKIEPGKSPPLKPIYPLS